MECYEASMALAEFAAHATETVTIGDLWTITWDTGVVTIMRWMEDIQAFCIVEGEPA